MRNNPYHKNLKDHLPLFMQGPRSTTAFVSKEEQKGIVEKVMIPPERQYLAENTAFNMVSPPVLNLNGIVTLPDLLKKEMGQTEVTQELFQAVMGWNDSSSNYDLQNPVVMVTWYDCISFCNNLSALLGFEECYRIFDKKMNYVHIRKAKVEWDESKNGFRLPTEEEWEIFAKAGTNNRWSGTNDENKLDLYAWYNRNSNYETHPVGEKLPNEWGLYDMSGNVWEWCWDSFSPNDTETRFIRGGSYWDDADGCRVADRLRYDADYRSDSRGFRLCRSIG